jgi:hypothetical protein
VATKIVYDDGETPDGKVPASAPEKPKSVFAPTLLRYVPWIVAALAVLVAVSVVVLATRGLDVPAPDVSPADAIVRATRDYERTMPDAFGRVERGLRDHTIKDKQSLVAELAKHAKPFAETLDGAVKPFMDDKGAFTDANGAADVMAKVQSALSGGKR